ncbi:MAG: ABC transporter ATP-binding protein [Phycisphaeraceae bacterium]|nr:ABC transporter ATP-binding protein [Phycisphaeraceae bacterium]
MIGEPLLRVRGLAVAFGRGGDRANAVDGVSFSLHAGQTLAVVGESGSGKSVTALSLLRLLPEPPARIVAGQAWLAGQDGAPAEDLLAMTPRQMRAIRGRRIAMIFQEPMSSLNPVYAIGDQIVEAVRLHQRVGRAEARAAAAAALADVGIDDPAGRLDAYPHQFSGGMRQRVMIAMALACRPAVLLADEPTTALDVTVQAQILDLIGSLQRSRGLGVVLITHALGLVARCAHVACVMYAGRVVEYAPVSELLAAPLHPYTRGLMSCTPALHAAASRLVTVRDVVEDRSSFERIAGTPGWTAWWPEHPPPPDARAAPGPGGSSVLHEVTPGRWVALWHTAELEAMHSREPDVPLTPATVASAR